MFRTVEPANPHPVIEDELKFGQRYRHEKQERRISIQPARSPSDSVLAQYKRIVEVDLPNIPVKIGKEKFQRPATAPALSNKGGKSRRKRQRKPKRKFPKKRPPCGKMPRKKGCITKTSELALPTAARLFGTWKDYYQVIPVDFVIRIKQMLNKEVCNDPTMCHKYFQTRDCLAKKKRCDCRSKNVKKCREKLKREKLWLAGEIYLTAELLINYLKSFKLGPELTVQQVMLSNRLMETLDEQGHLKLKVDLKGRHCSDCYHKIGDQLAVWMDDVLRYVDFEISEMGKVPQEDSSTSTLSSSLHSSKSYPSLSTITSEAFLISQVSSDVFSSLPSDLSIPSPIPSDWALFGILAAAQEKLEESIAGTIAGSAEEKPDLSVVDQIENEMEGAGAELGESGDQASGTETISTRADESEISGVEEDIAIAEAAESEISEVPPVVSGAPEDAIEEGPVITEMEKLVTGQGEDLGAISEAGGKDEEQEEAGPLVSQKDAELLRPDQGLLDRGRMITEATGSLTEFIDEDAPEEGPLPVIGMATIIFAHRASKLMDHRPDKLCCLTLRSWAIWLVETANTMHSWTVTLNQTIAEVRRTAAVLRGALLYSNMRSQIRDCNGRVVKFDKREWIQLTRKIASLAAAWRQYSRHVRDKTDEIIACEDVDVTCCHKCADEEIILNNPAAKNIAERLINAARTVTRWKNWLDEIVYETERLSQASTTPPKPCHGPCSRHGGGGRGSGGGFTNQPNQFNVIMPPKGMDSLHQLQ